MNITAQALTQKLQERIAPEWLEVLDESAAHAGHVGASDTGVGTHFRVRIKSSVFAGKTRVQRHRLVYDALQEFIDAGLHALAIEVIEN